MVHLRRRGLFAAAATGATALATLRPALAQPAVATNWPDRPVRIIVPYNAGGITDVISRGMAVGLQAALGQPVVVENRPGANGTVGTLAAARARRRTARRSRWASPTPSRSTAPPSARCPTTTRRISRPSPW